MSTFQQKYTVVDKLPPGSYGQAYLVKSNQDKRLFMSKAIDISTLAEPQLKSTLSYLNTVKDIKHPHLLQHIEYFVEEGRLVLILEYCEFGNLYKHIEKRTPTSQYFSQHLIQNWLLQLVMALDTLHKKKILHRDVNLANLYLTNNAVLKVGGVALPNVIRMDQGKISDREFCISPEICLNQPYTEKSDIWSMGCVVFAMASLMYPFKGKSLMGLVKSVVGKKLPAIPNCYSPGLRQIINKILTKDATKRPNASSILFDPLMIRIMQKSMSTSNNLKKEFSVSIQAKNVPTEMEKKESLLKQKPKQPQKSPQKPKQSEKVITSPGQMEEHQKKMLEKVRQFEKQAREKLVHLKQEIKDPKMMKGIEEELQLNIKTLYRAIDEGYKELSHIKSPMKTSSKIAEADKSSASKISSQLKKEKSIISDSKGVTLLGEPDLGNLEKSRFPLQSTVKSVIVDFNDLALESKIPTANLSSIGAKQVESRIFTTSSVQLTQSKYFDTLQLQAELKQMKNIAEQIKQNPSNLLDVDFAYTLSAAGTINRRTLQKTLQQFNLTTQSKSQSRENKSSIKFDMTMSKSQGKEFADNISQQYKEDFEEEEKNYTTEVRKNEEMVSAYRSQLAQLDRHQNPFLVLSEIKEVSNQDSQISENTFYRFGIDTKSEFKE